MKNYFKPEDFRYLGDADRLEDAIVERANEKLEALIESWPVVRGAVGEYTITQPFGGVDGTHDTHQARLAFIEPIVKEPCRHEPDKYEATKFLTRDGWVYQPIICKHCGVELIATWSEAKK